MYIGSSPTIGNFQVCDAISVVNGQASYTMQVSGVNATPQSANHMLVSLNGILQAPNSSFTVASSTITFASNLQTGDVIDFIQILGDVLDLGVPSDNTVSLAKLTATGTKDATTFLRGDNTFATVVSGLTMADQWRLTATTNLGTSGDVTSNWERVDSPGWSGIGTGLTESSGIFTFPQTGIYKIDFIGVINQDDGDGNVEFALYNTIDNSTYYEAAQLRGGNTGSSDANGTVAGVFLFDVTNTTTHKFKFRTNSFSGTTLLTGDTSVCSTGFNVTRLGDT